jgi:hypothetical protein
MSMMTYRVFDTSINRLYGAFATEEEAMALVQTLVGDNSDDFADDLAVGLDHGDGTFAEPLSGAALLARAAEVLPRDTSARSKDEAAVAIPG